MPSTSSGFPSAIVAVCAPDGEALTVYDAAHMLTYARLIDAERDDIPWQAAAKYILLLDIAGDPAAAERCWRSHLDRALWTISTPGLEASARACEDGWFAPDPEPAPDPSNL